MKKYKWFSDLAEEDYPEEGVNFLCGILDDHGCLDGMDPDDEETMIKEIEELFGPDYPVDVPCEYTFSICPNDGETFDDIKKLIAEKMNGIADYDGTSQEGAWVAE